MYIVVCVDQLRQSGHEPTPIALEWLPGRYAMCRLDAGAAVPAWASGPVSKDAPLISITRTERELSILAPEPVVPAAVRAERGWVALRVRGQLDFALVGILARLTGALAQARVPVCAISTYDTDILLVRAPDANRALIALRTVADIPTAPPPQ